MITLYWRDVSTGKKKPFGDVVLQDVGKVPAILVLTEPNIKQTKYVILDSKNRHILGSPSQDKNPPFQAMNDKGVSLEPGHYTFIVETYDERRLVETLKQPFNILSSIEQKPAEEPDKVNMRKGVCAVTIMDGNIPITSNLYTGTKPLFDVYNLLKVDTMREWCNIAENKIFDLGRAADYLANGFKAIHPVFDWGNEDRYPKPGEIANLMKTYIDLLKPIKPYVENIEIGNEPLIGKYWLRKLTRDQAAKTYLDLFLKPASKALRDAGYKVSNGGLNGDFAAQYKLLQSMGMDDYIDYVNIHPYQKTANSLRNTYTTLQALTQKPIIEGEANAFIFGDGPVDETAAVTEQLAQHNVKQDFNILVSNYFMSRAQNETPTGPAGLIHTTVKNNINISGTASPYLERFYFEV